MSNGGGRELRRHDRAPIELSGDLDSPTKGNLTAVTRDLSVGGAALECELPLVEGESVRLSLFLVYEGIEDERTPPLVVGARVQWVAEGDDGSHTAGVKFEQITEAQQHWLQRVLAVATAGR